MHRKTIALAVLAACPALSQAAEPLSSSFIEASYLNSTLETTVGSATTEDEVEGFRTALSVGLSKYVNFVGDFDQRRYQDSRDSFGSAGLAVHTLDPTWQVFGAVTWEYAAFDDKLSSAGDHDESGYGVTAGGRAVMENVELHASYKYIDLGNAYPDVALTGARFGGGLVLDLTRWWSLSADYVIRTHEYDTAAGTEQEWQEYTVGFRRYFVTQADRGARKGGLLTGLFSGEDETAPAEGEAAAE